MVIINILVHDIIIMI